MKRRVSEMRYNASRGGHAPGHIRDAFAYCAIETNMFQTCKPDMDVTEYIDDWNGRKWTLRSLLGQLWNCTDIMPWELCGDLGFPAGSTHAQAARALRTWLTKRNVREMLEEVSDNGSRR